MRIILAAVDLGVGADHVLEGAATLARWANAALHVLHVSESVAPDTVLSQAAQSAMAREREELTVLVQRCCSGRRIESQEIVTGKPADAILERSRAIGADLIVLGAHTDRDSRARIFGTTAERVVQSSRVPCLITRAALPHTLESVMVPTDFSPESVAAAQVAAQWLQLFSAPSQLHLLHVARPIDRMDDPEFESRSVRPRFQELEQQLDKGNGMSVQVHVWWSNHAAAAIRQWAETHSSPLLVLGTKGRGGLRDRLLGSVALATARDAPCSVLLVPLAARAPQRRGEPRLACIVTGIDFSAASLAAADWIHAILPTARHVLVHITEPPDAVDFGAGGADVRGQLVERARQEAAERLTRLFPELTATGRQTASGRAADELIRSAQTAGADLVCIGGHSHSRGQWGRLGSTADQLLRLTGVPVLIVRGRPEATPARVLAPVDASAECRQVLRWAATLARNFGAELQVFHVSSPQYLGAAKLVSGMAAAGELERAYVKQAEQWLRDQIVSAGLDLSNCVNTVVIGAPAHEILTRQEGWPADLIVLGNRGAGAISKALLGSVAASVVRDATCPVLLVPGEGE